MDCKSFSPDASKHTTECLKRDLDRAMAQAKREPEHADLIAFGLQDIRRELRLRLQAEIGGEV